ncbi:hypothetical protein NQ315_007620 [Exocentrus adspersus]|uniref:protein-histidine N-methyltransferase n=1 Tax=Exocentrus adspersus TaxID=1586481 RepID=A0AAV8W868_9CUCU|nr:hypothetical protein NQ315_007620 [Exocentrus adspersus]
MGRKGQGHKPKHSFKAKNEQRLTREEKELLENVDKLLRISTIPQQPNVLKALENQREISLITDKIKNLEIDKDSKSPSADDNRCTAATIERFTKWMVENGAQFKGCSITEFKGYELGLRVNTDIPQSSLVLAVPRKLMMSIETAGKSELRHLMEKDQILKNMHNVTLSIFLLLEKFKENSFWKPYIDILPKIYTTVLYFSTEELEELKGSPVLDPALRQIKSIARQYAYFYKLFHSSEDAVSQVMRDKFTYKDWAVSTVMTRQNTIPSLDGGNMINALIPLWDMCNHTNGTISTDYNPQLDRCECLALKDFGPGEQFFIFYGARTNADLFIHNGFVYEDNVHDGYWIRLGVSKSDPLEEKRKELLRRLSISPTSEFFIRKGSEPIDGELLAFLRIFNMNEEQLQHWLDSDKSNDLQYAACALDTSLERKCWSFLQARLKLLLGIYKTTLQEDLAMIQESTGTNNKRLAVRMRATEKKILRDTVEYVEQFVKQ